MVNYIEINLQKGKKYQISCTNFPNEEAGKRFWRTHKNLSKMFAEERPITVIVPDRILSEEEIEEYRKFFCTRAKKIKRNCIYFTFPIKIKEVIEE